MTSTLQTGTGWTLQTTGLPNASYTFGSEPMQRLH